MEESKKKMRGIGIANIVDEVNVRENSGIERINRMPYPQRGEYETLISMGENHFEDGAKHVMIGHSGWQTDDHCEVVDMPRRFKNKNMVIRLRL